MGEQAWSHWRSTTVRKSLRSNWSRFTKYARTTCRYMPARSSCAFCQRLYWQEHSSSTRSNWWSKVLTRPRSRMTCITLILRQERTAHSLRRSWHCFCSQGCEQLMCFVWVGTLKWTNELLIGKKKEKKGQKYFKTSELYKICEIWCINIVNKIMNAHRPRCT